MVAWGIRLHCIHVLFFIFQDETSLFRSELLVPAKQMHGSQFPFPNDKLLISVTPLDMGNVKEVMFEFHPMQFFKTGSGVGSDTGPFRGGRGGGFPGGGRGGRDFGGKSGA